MEPMMMETRVLTGVCLVVWDVTGLTEADGEGTMTKYEISKRRNSDGSSDGPEVLLVVFRPSNVRVTV